MSRAGAESVAAALLGWRPDSHVDVRWLEELSCEYRTPPPTVGAASGGVSQVQLPLTMPHVVRHRDCAI